MSDDIAVELIAKAVADHAHFKHVARELEWLPPSHAAADALAAAFLTGKAPPWLTAHLLGCVGDKSSYGLVREILLSAPGLLTESYAGPALAKIAGTDAYDDLCVLLHSAPMLRSREGAAYGLAQLASHDVPSMILDAARSGKIRWHTAAAILARIHLAIGQVLELLQSSNAEALRLGTEIVWLALHDSNASCRGWLDQPEIAGAIRNVLTVSTFRMVPRKRRALAKWATERV